jgi:hypothetical protein
MSIVPPDPEADQWYRLAQFGFWLRHPKALATMPQNLPDLAGEMESFRRLGWELALLESDLAYCVHELYTAFEALYADPHVLFRKKFAVVYHIDNFYVRVHKLMDNTYQLAAKVAGFNWESRREDRPTRRQVKDGLNLRKLDSISRLLETFEENKWIKQAVEARNLFVHLYRDEPTWPMLSAMDRFYESVGGNEDPEAEQIRQIQQSPDLDRYADKKAKELQRTLSVIGKFRVQLYDAFVENLVQLASTMSTEVQDSMLFLTGR